MPCSERFNIQSEGYISQLWNTVGRYNFLYLHKKLIYTKCEQCYARVSYNM